MVTPLIFASYVQIYTQFRHILECEPARTYTNTQKQTHMETGSGSNVTNFNEKMRKK